MTTGERIKAARLKAGFTQKQLAQELKIPYQSIGQWERDIRNPKQETLLKIAKILGVHLRDLVDHSIWEEFDLKSSNMEEEFAKLDQFINYLKSIGFSVNHILHREPPDDYTVELSKDQHKATFTQAEFEELQSAAKEVIQGKFYKKLLDQLEKK